MKPYKLRKLAFLFTFFYLKREAAFKTNSARSMTKFINVLFCVVETSILANKNANIFWEYSLV